MTAGGSSGLPTDLLLTIDPNPNCDAVDGMLYHALATPRIVSRIRVTRERDDRWCWVTGVEPGGRWISAQAHKIADSGSGVAYLIVGGGWGLRFAEGDVAPRWDLRDPAQWGEPYKLYGDPKDLVFLPPSISP